MMTPRRLITSLGALILGFSLVLAGCGRARFNERLSQEEQWDLAKNHFLLENYLTTIDVLTSFTLNYSGSTIIDSAQFLLAESHFALGEYILAESEYNRLRQNTPQSPLAPEAQLKIVLCNAYLSPSPGLDQRFTDKTIASAQNYKDDYPEADVGVRLAKRGSGWNSLGRIFTLGLWKPREADVQDVPVFETKVVYPHLKTGFGHWLLGVVTFGIYNPPAPRLVIPLSKEVKGDWLASRAMDDSRNKLAKKDFKAGELYYRQQKYPSAVIYFDRVLDLYGDTSWARPSLRIKGDALFAMKQYSQAADAYARFLNLYGDDPMHFVNKRLEESRKHPEPQPQTPPDTTMAAPDSSQSSLEP